jgi:hypothetical protein
LYFGVIDIHLSIQSFSIGLYLPILNVRAYHKKFSLNRLSIYLLPAFSAMAEPTAHEETPRNIAAEAKNLRKKPLPPSIFPRPKKITIIILVSAATFIGPAAAGIYYPSLAPLAKALHVSPSQISFTVTAYMVPIYSTSRDSTDAERANPSPTALPGPVSATDRGHV